MTERKPIGTNFETWIDRQIREAAERGEFDDLPGAGKPLPDRGEASDEMWWVKQKLAAENLSFPLPATLQLRKEAEDALEAAAAARSEAQVREIVAAINEKILDGTRKAMSGPPLNLMPYDVEEILDDWRGRRTAEPAPVPPPAPAKRTLLDRLRGRRSR
ncbi:DUF1992 domain-containing protein [Streptosporangiaceae bacterium NEAU-GS5]|nr:DUF1992 domain-containing protein [Streptosporangiaceae bacterium NEAU-GS5]